MGRNCHLLLLSPLYLLTIFGILAVADALFIDSKSCALRQFQCENGKCIPAPWVCDLTNDCGDNSDETNKKCKGSQKCSDTQFKCTNGKCIPGSWHCDNEHDCSDGSDEDPAVCSLKNCTTDQFTCHSGNGECVALAWMCDSHGDCSDGSDEAECNITCRSDEFTCTNKYCIQKLFVCDGDDDCGDGSDEKNCKSVTCGPTEFACSENSCITSLWRCDGDVDCPDKSDEIGCKYANGERSSPCNKDKDFDCDDGFGTCIHESWVCDGEKDCRNGVDESPKRCHNVTCRPDQFLCEDYRNCISGHLYCNGKAECADGSDEKNCTSKPIICDPLTQFECSEGSCIPLSSVCNKNPDCIGWEDENTELCGVDECAKNNGGCSQICIDLPIGFRCDCNAGYRLIDNRTCDDIDECLEPGSCSQFCLNEKGSFKCSCAPGYLKDRRNHTRCKASEGHASLLFTSRHDIRKVALDRLEMTNIVKDTKMAAALDFVFRTGMIFWSDSSEKKIYKAPIDEGNERTVVINDGLTRSDGLAVDWIYNHIYWTDSKKSTIELANFEGNMRKTLIQDRMQEPRAIALNPLEGWMFWTDWSDEAHIEKAGMDGSHRTVIVDNGVQWPNGLTLDLIGKKVYWVDAKLNMIGSCNYDGSGVRRVLFSPKVLRHPFSITTFEDYVYWTDWDKEAIFKANKFNGQSVEAVTSLRTLKYPMVVHVYHPYRQPDGMNQCQAVNGHCSHLCLPAPRINSKSPLLSCACPDGLRLLPDGLMCVEKVSTTVAPTTQEISKPFKRLEPVNITTTTVHPTHSADEDGKDGLTSESTDPGLVAGIVIGVASLGLLLLALVAVLCYRHYLHRNVTSMNFDNPVYRKTTEDQFSLEKNRFPLPTATVGEEAQEPLTSPGTNDYV
ncbi:PREDICTED: very low-density lipoprotein receptor-like isoform X1 [Eufriesea mexicana]|uniref:very low-density lipoprotein receptor-like isoform X1 n=1 Tax=Eufriesea mexicana TaxID=516756 RepID=UPI00083C42E7|nr:PREDICTED: very low-density lipoprotein receptor-like isoform X1 [Eufriesea mexicana]XP_017755667.1 PREDICTED: very low-density lipoprotein receptor-like isoform X1 [Eufriesea mexicana]